MCMYVINSYSGKQHLLVSEEMNMTKLQNALVDFGIVATLDKYIPIKEESKRKISSSSLGGGYKQILKKYEKQYESTLNTLNLLEEEIEGINCEIE